MDNFQWHTNQFFAAHHMTLPTDEMFQFINHYKIWHYEQMLMYVTIIYNCPLFVHFGLAGRLTQTKWQMSRPLST